nr:hypothetical protein Q903MT_gene274 [Picea sitchensis]
MEGRTSHRAFGQRNGCAYGRHTGFNNTFLRRGAVPAAYSAYLIFTYVHATTCLPDFTASPNLC